VSTFAPLTRDIEKIGSWKKEDDGEDVFWADKGMVRYLRDKPTYDVKAADVYDGPIVSLANRLRFLVEETGLDKRTINRIKSGDVTPAPEHVELLQHAVQVWVENWSVRIKDDKGVVIAELCCDRLRESGRLVLENGRKIVKVNMNVSLWRRSRVKITI
jgi:hypothetical protein